MFPPFPTDEAQKLCTNLLDTLDRLGRLDIDTPDSSADPTYSLRVIQKDAPGFMVGICICRDSDENTIVLKAFSGQYNGRWTCPGWCPPLLNPDAYDRCIVDSDREIHELSKTIDDAEQNATSTEDTQTIQNLKEKRAALSRISMEKIFDLYTINCLTGEVTTFRELTHGYPGGKLLPTGTGDCCAPKLLNTAAVQHLVPISLAECYYSHDNSRGITAEPCDEKCSLILPVMLGLEIVYRDEYLIVINKPSGLLSVPGRGEDKQDCAVTRVQRLFPFCIQQPSVHRLDMDTSGLLVLAFDADTHRELSRQFMNSTVYKQYTALLDGVPNAIKRGARRGIIVSHFRLDPENRPHQIYDPEYGKQGITEWALASIERGRARIIFTPKTGRTHQLRLHSAHTTGFGVPIAGDNLYGDASSAPRLMLHCHTLSFIHPKTGKKLTFTTRVPF